MGLRQTTPSKVLPEDDWVVDQHASQHCHVAAWCMFTADSEVAQAIPEGYQKCR